MRLLFLLMLHHAAATAYDCNIFFNYFTVNNGKFTNVCGNITMFGYNTDRNYLSSTYLTDHVNSNDSTFRIEGGEYVAYTMVPFDSNQWAIVYEGYSTKMTKSGFNIILGPGGASNNNQLRYEGGDRICIYSYYSSYYGKCMSLLYDINVMHSLIFYYDNSEFSIYQNNEYVGSLSGTLQTAYAKIGGWYHTYSGNLAVKNVMFSTNVALHDIREYLYGMQAPSINSSFPPTASSITVNPSFTPTALVTTRNASVTPATLVTASLVPISFISTISANNPGHVRGHRATSGNNDWLLLIISSGVLVIVLIVIICISFMFGVYCCCIKSNRSKCRRVMRPASQIGKPPQIDTNTKGTSGITVPDVVIEGFVTDGTNK